jgi:hypothetical protein
MSRVPLTYLSSALGRERSQVDSVDTETCEHTPAEILVEHPIKAKIADELSEVDEDRVEVVLSLVDNLLRSHAAALDQWRTYTDMISHSEATKSQVIVQLGRRVRDLEEELHGANVEKIADPRGAVEGCADCVRRRVVHKQLRVRLRKYQERTDELIELIKKEPMYLAS